MKNVYETMWKEYKSWVENGTTYYSKRLEDGTTKDRKPIEDLLTAFELHLDKLKGDEKVYEAQIKQYEEGRG